MKYYIIYYKYTDGRRLIKGVVEHIEVVLDFIERMNKTLPNKFGYQEIDTNKKEKNEEVNNEQK